MANQNEFDAIFKLPIFAGNSLKKNLWPITRGECASGGTLLSN